MTIKEKKKKTIIHKCFINFSDFYFSVESDEKINQTQLGLCFKKQGHCLSNKECTQKNHVLFFEVCLQYIKIHETMFSVY